MLNAQSITPLITTDGGCKVDTDAADRLRKFEFLVKCGIDKLEVLWFANMIGTKQAAHPVAKTRMRDVLKKARAGLDLQKASKQTFS